MSNKRIRSVVEKIVGGRPSDKAFYKSAKSTYQNKAFDNIEGYEKIYDGKTIDGFLNPNSREILIGVRGTGLSVDDLKADVNIVSNNLKNTTRYKNDVNQINQIFQQYPPEQYNYYLGGHSLGSAIISQLKRDYPFLKDAVVFNGALQPVDISNQHKDMKFKYIDKDPLYNIVGKSVQNKEVLPYEELKRGSFFGRIGATLQPTALKAHKLEQFEKRYGGNRKAGFIRAIEAGKPSKGKSTYPSMNVNKIKRPSMYLRVKYRSQLPPAKKAELTKELNYMKTDKYKEEVEKEKREKFHHKVNRSIEKYGKQIIEKHKELSDKLKQIRAEKDEKKKKEMTKKLVSDLKAFITRMSKIKYIQQITSTRTRVGIYYTDLLMSEIISYFNYFMNDDKATLKIFRKVRNPKYAGMLPSGFKMRNIWKQDIAPIKKKEEDNTPPSEPVYDYDYEKKKQEMEKAEKLKTLKW